ncbi:hypothetical protein F5X99DRAFT_373623 [Biscogniauxia marginata]|nr:hypothetical protein F5X99DRAFT_373623 [Biscogniauxia marginata]
MLRHSASQIFGSKHPALTRANTNDDRTTPMWMWGIGSRNSRVVAQQQQELPPVQTQQLQNEAAALPIFADPSLVFAPAGPAMPITTTTTIPPGNPSTQIPAGFESAWEGGAKQQQQQKHHHSQDENAMLTTMALVAAAAARNGRDTSSRHPVFFTERLHPAPFYVLDAAAVTSPVAHGYVYHENQRRADGAIPAML